MSRGTSEALREACRALRELGERGRTTRVPQRARRAVLAYVEAARDEGLAWRHIAREVGLSETALRRWRGENGGGEHVALLPVEVISEEEAVVVASPARDDVSLLTLITPGGYRVEGLGVDELAALLARVG